MKNKLYHPVSEVISGLQNKVLNVNSIQPNKTRRTNPV